MMNKGIMKVLTECFQSADCDIREYAAFAIANICSNPDYLAKVGNSGGIPPLIMLSKSDNVNTLCLGMAGLRRLANSEENWPRLIAAGLLDCLASAGFSTELEIQREVAAALCFVANRCDARRAVWLGDALRLEWIGDGAHGADVGNASAQARALDLATTLTQLLEWRGAAWCARVQATVLRGLESQALVRFSQVRIATARLVAATLVAVRGVEAAAARSGELVRQLVERAAAQSELLELLLVVVLDDAALAPAFADELARVVPVVLDGQRDNDPERATMARHAAALLMQYSLSGAQLDALLEAMRAQVANTGDAAAWQSRRVALPMLQLLAFRLRFDGGARARDHQADHCSTPRA